MYISKRLKKLYKEIFSFLSHVPLPQNISSSVNTERYSQSCQKHIDDYPEDFNSNFSAELQQFHSNVLNKFSETKVCKNKSQDFNSGENFSK